MDWKKLALCMALAGGTVACGGPSEDGPGDTRRYVLSAVEISPPNGAMATGFNLDGEVSDGETGSDGMPATSCVELTRDFSSINDPGEDGVDNGLAGLVTTLAGLVECPEGTTADTCLTALLAEQIADGSVLLVMEVSGIHSYANDSSIELQLYLGEVPGCDETDPATCMPTLADDGTIEPGQDFTLTPVGDAVSGSITGGRMRAQTPSLTISINTGGLELDLVLHDAEVRANINETSLTNGAIGGSIVVEELATTAEAFMEGAGDLVRSVVGGIADIDPSDADETMCESLSAGIAFTGVDAVDPAAED